MKKVLYYSVVLLVLAACSTPDSSKMKFVDVPGIDSSVKPGDNFFRYVNGKWYDTVKIDADQVGVGSYRYLNIPQKKLLQHILDSVSKNTYASGTIEQKVGDFYASGMDTTTVNQRGYEPIKPLLDRINAIKDVPALMKYVADELKAGDRSIIEFGIWPDNKKSSINIAHATQAGIGLPDREYYFKTDSSTLAIQQAYKKYIAALFTLTGSDAATAAKNVDIIYGIEKQIANVHKTNIELRDVKTNYNRLPVAVIDKEQPNIGWSSLLQNLDAKTDSLDVPQLAYYDKLNALLKSVSLNDWKVFLKASTMGTYANALSSPFVKTAFELNKALSGQAVQKPRALVMAEGVDRSLGEALGQLYVKRYFNEDAKKRVLDLVNNLQKSFESRISQLDWMSDSTKKKAKEKLYAITKKIGYPDKWRDYDKVNIDRTKYFENVISLNQNEYQFQLAKLNKRVDKTEWGTTPSTVTAYYNPFYNEIVFPAGILQYPYFDFKADDAINYGGIGMVIGHELTHAFDDQGAQFDKDGNVKNWWTKEDYEKFRAKTQQVIDLYSSFSVLDDVHIKGALTVGENTADNGGLAIAYDAFKMTPQGKDSVKIDGYTPDQRFFLSVARIWRVKTRDAFMRMYVNTDPHSPAMWRVNGPLTNFTPFYNAFNVQQGDKNFKSESDRIKIW
ncbi:metallopeptidase [Cytophagales bacterium WSM2-2]|nr:metallopeptidase [Cytophagales bacterium WSM2-2]